MTSSLTWDNMWQRPAACSDILRRVFPENLFRRPIGYANGYNGRIGADIIVGAKGSRIEAAFLIMAGDPGNRSRGSEANEQVISLVVTYFRKIEVHDLMQLGANRIDPHRISSSEVVSGEQALSSYEAIAPIDSVLGSLQRCCRVTR
jgi:hypothetical protein